MKSGYKIGIISLLIAVVFIAIIQASEKKPTDWNKTYYRQDKIPFGTYVFYHELKTIFSDNKKINYINEPLFQYFNKNDSLQNYDYIYVGSGMSFDSSVVQKLLEFAAKGNTIFISTEYTNYLLNDTLKINTEYNYKFDNKSDSFKISLAKFGKYARYDKSNYHYYFSKLNKKFTILGYLKSDSTYPNFVVTNFGKGKIYLQLAPQVFTNYYLLKKSDFSIAYNSIKYLKGKKILWFDGKYNYDDERTPIRFILSQPALRWAWYLLLLALIALLIFRTKREQKAIPIIEPERNRSVDFAQTIGSLYYENGTPGNMVLKKIEYFLFSLRQNYNLDTDNLNDEKTIYRLTQITHLEKEEVQNFINELINFRKKGIYSENDLKYINQLIEKFKLKTNLI